VGFLTPDILPLAVKLFVFDIAVLPLLIDNLRTGEANNRDNLILVAGGIAMIGIEHALGWSDQSLWEIGAWVVFGVIGLFVLAFVAGMPGGVAKTMMALLFWFPSMAFVVMFAIAWFVTALIGYASGSREVPIVPAIVVVCTGIWSFENVALGFFSGGAVLLFGWLASRRA